MGPVFTFSLAGGGGRFSPQPPINYATDQVHFKHEQPQVLLIESYITIGTIQQTQDAASVLWVYRRNSWHQGCGVGVAENFNDSDSGQTFSSPIVTVCATNMRKRHTWQFNQLDASTRYDHGYSEGRQRTSLRTFNQGPFQISSVPWAHHATYTLWMQPFGACITEISICSFWLALWLLRDVGYATMNESSHGSSSIVT